MQDKYPINYINCSDPQMMVFKTLNKPLEFNKMVLFVLYNVPKKSLWTRHIHNSS